MKRTLSYSRYPLMAMAIALPAWSTGCVPVNNGLLGGPPLSALSGSSPENAAPQSWSPSLTGDFDRSDWTHSEVQIPVAEVQHNPTYAGDPIGGDQMVGRVDENGAFPTVETATSVEVDGSFVIKSALIAPFIALGDLVASPIRMCIVPPWAIQAGPDAEWSLLPLHSSPATSTPEAAVAPVSKSPILKAAATSGSKSDESNNAHPFERSADAGNQTGGDR
ncbi:MAG: hypothetical protein QMB94_02285 [Phycisphaerales bacterium]